MMRALTAKLIGMVFFSLLLSGLSVPAHSTTIGLTGFVDFADPGNIWGIDTASEVTGTASWDETLLGGVGAEILSYDPFFSGPDGFGNVFDSTMDLTLNVGSFSFMSSSFDFFDFGFLDGLLTDISYFSSDFSLDITGGPVNTFFLYEPFSFSASVTGQLAPAPVPEPGTIVLLSVGLGGLFLAHRRRRHE